MKEVRYERVSNKVHYRQVRMLRMNHVEDSASAIEHNRRYHQVPELKAQYRLEKCINNSYHEQGIQVPELLNPSWLNNQVEIIDRPAVRIHIIGKDQLQGDLNGAPHKKRI